MQKHVTAALLAVLTFAPSAHAQEREWCPDRPGFTTPACLIEPGRVSAELGLADWSRDDAGESREDEFVTGDLLLRTGLGPATELRVGWTAFGHTRRRDFTGVEVENGVGDVTIGLTQSLRNPDGSGVAVAAMTEVSLPVGGDAVGAGDWGARFLLPASAELSEVVQFAITPEIDAAPDEDRRGRHLRYGTSAGVQFNLSETVNLQSEVLWLRDHDPGDRHTELQAGLFLAGLIAEDWQADAGGAFGLNRDTPDLNLSFGISHRF